MRLKSFQLAPLGICRRHALSSLARASVVTSEPVRLPFSLQQARHASRQAPVKHQDRGHRPSRFQAGPSASSSRKPYNGRSQGADNLSRRRQPADQTEDAAARDETAAVAGSGSSRLFKSTPTAPAEIAQVLSARSLGSGAYFAQVMPTSGREAREIYDTYVTLKEQNAGSRASYYALAEMLDGKDIAEMTSEGRAAALQCLSATWDPGIGPTPTLLRQLAEQMGDATPDNMFALQAYSRALLRRAIHSVTQWWMYRAQERRLAVTRQADPWRRSNWFAAARHRKIFEKGLPKEDVAALVREAVDVEQRTVVVDLSHFLPEQLVAHLDFMVYAASHFPDNNVAESVLTRRTQLGLEAQHRVCWKLMRVARARGDAALTSLAWQTYQSIASAVNNVDQDQPALDDDRVENEVFIWSDYIGCLIDRGDVKEAVKMTTEMCSGRFSETSGTSRATWNTALRSAVVFQVTKQPSRPVIAFLETCWQNDALRERLAESGVLSLVADRLLYGAEEPHRLKHLRRIVDLIATAADTSKAVAEEGRYVLPVAVEGFLAAANAAGESAQLTRDHVKRVAEAYDIYAAHLPVGQDMRLVAKVVDALALVGQHNDAIATARSALEQQRAGIVDRGRYVAERYRHDAQLLLECALGLHIQASSNTPRQLLDVAAMLSDLQSSNRPLLSQRLRVAIEKSLSTYDTRGITELISGEHGRTLYICSQAVDDEDASPLCELAPFPRVCSRAPGRTIPFWDELASGKIWKAPPPKFDVQNYS